MVDGFRGGGDQRYGFIARTVKRFGYGRLKRSDKAIVLRFLERVSGYSRQQIARLVKRGSERRAIVKRYCGSRTSFARTYTEADNWSLRARWTGRQTSPVAPGPAATRAAQADTRARWRSSPGGTTAGRHPCGRRREGAHYRWSGDLSDHAPQHWRRVLGSYVLVDLAHKVVGVGSVGLRAFVGAAARERGGSSIFFS